MGILDFVKGGVKELAIARPDAFKNHIVYKHPDPTIPMKAQLTVEADELALFFKDGQLVGQLGPGRHTLDSSNIPFLGQIVDKFTDGNVFIAEVYFVTVRELTDVKFGGPIGKVRDAQSGLLVQMMVHGTFSTRVLDPIKLVIGLVGLQKQDGNEFLTWFKQLVVKILKDHVGELCVKKKWPLPDVVSGAYTSEIEAEVLKGFRPEVEPYGLEIVRLGDFQLAMGTEDDAKLSKFYERASYVNMTGGLAGYQQFAQAEMMMQAGEGMAKGGGGGGSPALDGAGLGLGFAMANQMISQNNRQAPTASAPATQQAASKVCPHCQASVAGGKFCSECGKNIGPTMCAKCNIAVTGKFCSECGSAV